MMLGDPDPNLLTAWHISDVTQSTALKMPTPAGTVSVVQSVPPLDVPMIIGVQKMPKPTAVQSEDVGQEMPLSPLTPAGIELACHVRPAFWLTRIEFQPMA